MLSNHDRQPGDELSRMHSTALSTATASSAAAAAAAADDDADDDEDDDGDDDDDDDDDDVAAFSRTPAVNGNAARVAGATEPVAVVDDDDSSGSPAHCFSHKRRIGAPHRDTARSAGWLCACGPNVLAYLQQRGSGGSGGSGSK